MVVKVTADEKQEIKYFMQTNSAPLAKLLAREVSKGASDPALAASVTAWVAGSAKKWWKPAVKPPLTAAAKEKLALKTFMKTNSAALAKVLDLEVAKGTSYPVLAASISSFVKASGKKWYWPF